MAKSLVIGNWKMFGSLGFNQDLIEDLSENLPPLNKVGLAVCPPSIYLSQVLVELDANELPIALGAQNVCAEENKEGAYTGEVSATMLADLEVQYTLVGHSERREYYGESDEVVLAKFKQLQEKGITAVLCVGEGLEQREAGETLSVIETQIKAVLDAVGIEQMQKAVIAYEPIWAIGTGKTASPEQAQEVHAYIRDLLAQADTKSAADISLLYGGSVKPDNAASLFAQQDIDGALVGGASLNAEQFIAIAKAAEAA